MSEKHVINLNARDFPLFTIYLKTLHQYSCLRFTLKRRYQFEVSTFRIVTFITARLKSYFTIISMFSLTMYIMRTRCSISNYSRSFDNQHYNMINSDKFTRTVLLRKQLNATSHGPDEKEPYTNLYHIWRLKCFYDCGLMASDETNITCIET